MYRTPESFEEIANWKGADWLYWTLINYILCLRGIVDNKIFKSLVLCNTFLTFLLGSAINKNKLEEFYQNIIEFQRGIQNTLGESSMTSNLHSTILT